MIRLAVRVAFASVLCGSIAIAAFARPLPSGSGRFFSPAGRPARPASLASSGGTPAPGGPNAIAGWPRSLGRPVAHASLVPVDLDGDGRRDLIVAADSALFAFRADGSPLFGSEARVGGFLPGRIAGEIAATELFRLGSEDASEAWLAASVEGHEGTAVVLWNSSGSHFPESTGGPDATTAPVFPVSGGVDPVVLHAVTGRADGSLRIFPSYPYGSITSGAWCEGDAIAALATVDRTGLAGDELVAVSVSGLVGVFRNVEDAPMAPGWPEHGLPTGGGHPPTRLRWALSGDVDRSDAGTPEIVVADSSGTVHLLDSVGDELPGWPVSLGAALLTSPVLGDVDGDGRLEIVAVDARARAHVLRFNGAEVHGWPRGFGEEPSADAGLGSLLVCDVRQPEGREVISYRPTGLLREVEGAAVPWIEALGSPPGSGPAALDIDGDGTLEVAAVDSAGVVHVVQTGRPAGRGEGEWRLAGCDPERRGAYPNDRLPEIRRPSGLLPEASVTCYPIPAPGNALFVHYALGRPAEVSLELFDMAGKRVASLSGTPYAGEDNVVRIPLKGLASGSYVLRIRAEDASGTITARRKVLVLR